VQRHGVGPRSFTAVRRLLAGARRRGFAEEDGSVTPGLASVGAAVLDHGGHPVAAVALTFPSAELDDDARGALAVQVRDAAGEISHHIRGRP